jgi:hypothetical protein
VSERGGGGALKIAPKLVKIKITFSSSSNFLVKHDRCDFMMYDFT